MRNRIAKDVRADLRNVPLFSSCTDRELKEVSSLGTPTPIRAGRKITVAGARGAEWFVVLSGRASCQVQGREVATFGPGDFFGELSLIDNGTRSASVIAETPMRLLDFDRREFDRLLDVAPSVARKMLSTMAVRLRAADSVIARAS
jgi:CRP/FNR family cyclic AMP-dependent transcriptional regulator